MQWIGGMRADEAIDYYMPSIAARSNHRSVSFARTRPTTIETPTALDCHSYDASSPRVSAQPQTTTTTTVTEAISADNDVYATQFHDRVPVDSVTKSLGGANTPTVLQSTSYRDRPAATLTVNSTSYSRTATLQVQQPSQESPHVTRLKSTVAGYNTRM